MLLETALGTLVAFATLLNTCAAQMIELKGGKDIEFEETLSKGQPWGVQFQTVDGTIAFQLASPSGVLFQGAAETYGSYSLTAKENGPHRLKFINTDPYGSPAKKVTFSLLGDDDKAAKQLDPVQNELKQLNAGLRLVSEEHAFLMDREKKHREVAESTKSRVFWWFVIQIGVIAGVCYFQIKSLESFFEVRRIV